MVKRKSKKRGKMAEAPVVKKYPFDPDNLEVYEPTADEFARLEFGSGGKPQAWKAPSQFEYDQLRKRLIAYDCDENTLVNYTITDAVKALKYGFERWVKDGRVGAELCMIWKERYLSVVNEPKRLRYWQQKEKDILNRMVTVNNEQLAKNSDPSIEEARGWLSEIWPFGEHCERSYKLPDDLDAIYLAVGLQLDRLFHARNLVTEEMVQVIIGEWQLTVQHVIGENDVLLRFGPCFNGEFMAYDDPLETFWNYIEGLLKPAVRCHTQKKRHKLPLSDNDTAVLELLENLSEREGLTGKEILQALDKKKIYVDQSTLTKSIIPRLQHKGYKIKNMRDGAGYYIKK